MCDSYICVYVYDVKDDVILCVSKFGSYKFMLFYDLFGNLSLCWLFFICDNIKVLTIHLNLSIVNVRASSGRI